MIKYIKFKSIITLQSKRRSRIALTLRTIFGKCEIHIASNPKRNSEYLRKNNKEEAKVKH